MRNEQKFNMAFGGNRKHEKDMFSVGVPKDSPRCDGIIFLHFFFRKHVFSGVLHQGLANIMSSLISMATTTSCPT
jgi:hypothetical protein